MPIADTELTKTANAHLLRPASETVYQTLQTWRSTPGSYEWWWLIIDHGSQRYTALRFESLRDLLLLPGAGVTMQTLLAKLPLRRDNPEDWSSPFPGVVIPHRVDQDSVGTARAWQMVNDSPGRVLIVLQGDQFRGILSASERTFAFADRLLVDMLDQYEQTPVEPLDPDLTSPNAESPGAGLAGAAPSDPMTPDA